MFKRILALSMILSAVFIFPEMDSASARTLRWGASGDVTSMDPYAYYTVLNAGVLHHVYEPLVRHDPKLAFEPALATSWERLSPTVWRFHLRRNVKFHNGNPFTADDVVASLTRASHPNSPFRAATTQIQETRKVDDYTVDVVLKTSYPLILNDLTGVTIMDKEWMTENQCIQPVNPSKGEESYATTHTNGTGSFILKTRRPDAETVFVVNPNWWRKREHNFDEIVYRPIRMDATRVAALLSGELDLIMPAPLQDIDRIRRDSSTEAMVGADLRVIIIGLNQGAPQLKASNIKGRNPLADVRVRKALQQGIDSRTLSQRVMKGLSKPTASIVAPEIQGYDPVLSEVIAPYDPDQAKKLLVEAGYPDGFEIGLSCPNDQHVNTEQVCQALTSMWARIGVKVNLTSQPSALHNRMLLNGDADLYLIGWANTPQMNAFSILNNVLKKGGTYNPGGYYNPKVEELVGQLAGELDEGKRQKMMTEALLIQKRDFAVISLHQDPIVWAKRKNLHVVQMPDNKLRAWWGRFTD
jgi:peptide/nickel transport system substrate-binding protein